MRWATLLPPCQPPARLLSFRPRAAGDLALDAAGGGEALALWGRLSMRLHVCVCEGEGDFSGFGGAMPSEEEGLICGQWFGWDVGRSEGWFEG